MRFTGKVSSRSLSKLNGIASGDTAEAFIRFGNVARMNSCARPGTDGGVIAFFSPARQFSSHSRRSFQSGLRRGEAVRLQRMDRAAQT
jgi:hypothetical protein